MGTIIGVMGHQYFGSSSSLPTTFVLLEAEAISHTEISLRWMCNQSVDGYILERSLTGVSDWTQLDVLTQKNYIDDNLNPGTTYYYRVRAISGGEPVSEWSDIQSAEAIPIPIPSDLILTVISDTEISLTWTDNAVSDSFVVERSLDGVIFSQIATPLTNSYNDTGLEPYTDYFYRVAAVKDGLVSGWSDVESAKTPYWWRFESTGDGSGVSTLRLLVSETMTVNMISGNARFYTDAAGTTGESDEWEITAGALRTIYLKAPSGTSVLNILNPDKVIAIGSTSYYGWESSTNAANFNFAPYKLGLINFRYIGNSVMTGALPVGLTYLRLEGNNINWTYEGALPVGLTYLYLQGNNINWTYEGALPVGLTYLYLQGNNINWTGLDVSGSSNFTTFILSNFRISKMSSADMVTFLTNLTNRVGGLPATVTINDYADYASPPPEVVSAVDLLKTTKSVSVVNLGA